ncbi:TPA: amidohydrolase/deacetylase family metallohydrolase [Candidatus Latescibacteria bacterium]|nr:amidohydrolase/deacetylase family metallohydrolase [Candidatus Latescibacterota bacterium]
MSETYDLIVKGGRVIDPRNGLDGALDVAFKGGRVAKVGDLSDASASESVDATGKLVTPGLIDLHTHLFKDFSIFGIDVDDLSPRTGVTPSVDTGTAGWINYGGFRKVIMEPAETRVLAYVNLSGVGLPYRRGEMVYEGYVQAGECAHAIQQFPEGTIGVKVRLYRGVGGDADLRDLLEIAIEAARRCEKPLMVHISGSDVPLPELLAPLRPRDVITHCYHGDEIAGILDASGKVLPEVRDARERGIIFDIGHGVGSFSFDVGRKAMDDGFPPDTISSDIHGLGIDGPTYDLPTTMSKFLHLGMPLEDIIERVTDAPARAVEWDLGHLGEGAVGDLTVLDMAEGAFELTDAEEVTLVADQRFACAATVKDGKLWYKK